MNQLGGGSVADDTIWIDARSRVYQIRQMNPDHLVSTLRHLERDAMNHHRCNATPGDDTSWEDYTHEKYPLLVAEAKRRGLAW